MAGFIFRFFSVLVLLESYYLLSVIFLCFWDLFLSFLIVELQGVLDKCSYMVFSVKLGVSVITSSILLIYIDFLSFSVSYYVFEIC